MDAHTEKAPPPLTGIILFSVLIHCALLLVPINLKPDTTTRANEPKTIAVQIINRKPQDKPIEEPVIQPIAQPEPVDEQPAVSATSVPVIQPQQEPKAPGPLDLSLPGDNNIRQKQFKSGLTRNGAFVMDGHLLKRLNESGPSAPASNSADSFIIHSSVSASRAHFMKIAGKCFKVVEANPQDSLSYESWWPVKCPR